MYCQYFFIWDTICALRIRPTNEALCLFWTLSSSVVHVPGVNDIQSSSSTGQNLTQISRQLNQSQVAWTGNRPPFPGQVLIPRASFSWSLKISTLCAFYRSVSKPIYVINLWLGRSCVSTLGWRSLEWQWLHWSKPHWKVLSCICSMCALDEGKRTDLLL